MRSSDQKNVCYKCDILVAQNSQETSSIDVLYLELPPDRAEIIISVVMIKKQKIGLLRHSSKQKKQRL